MSSIIMIDLEQIRSAAQEILSSQEQLQGIVSKVGSQHSSLLSQWQGASSVSYSSSWKSLVRTLTRISEITEEDSQFLYYVANAMEQADQSLSGEKKVLPIFSFPTAAQIIPGCPNPNSSVSNLSGVIRVNPDNLREMASVLHQAVSEVEEVITRLEQANSQVDAAWESVAKPSYMSQWTELKKTYTDAVDSITQHADVLVKIATAVENADAAAAKIFG